MFPVQLSRDGIVAIETSYTDARANLARLLDRVTQDREIVVINRRGQEDVAMIAASELSSLVETAYLLRSPKNAQRLLEAMRRSLADEIRSRRSTSCARSSGLIERPRPARRAAFDPAFLPTCATSPSMTGSSPSDCWNSSSRCSGIRSRGRASRSPSNTWDRGIGPGA